MVPTLENLRSGHPRLYLTPELLDLLRQDIYTEPVLRQPLDELVAAAEAILDEPPVEFKIVGPRLLDQSQKCRRRVPTLALAYLLTGRETFANRAVAEMEAAAAFPHWNPSHFLDTAELAAALGIGYDWLFDYMSDDQRAVISAALREKGLQPGLSAYRGTEGYGWWKGVRGNWSVVCNGGLAIGALAVADEDQAVAAEILESGLKSVRLALDDWGPDGSWRDGPGYWAYTMEFTALYLDALRTALGSMKDLERSIGLAEAGRFRIASIGPTGRVFNFADAVEATAFSPAMCWLARTFSCPMYVVEEWKRVDGNPMGLVWGRQDPQAMVPLAQELGMDKVTGVSRSSYFRRDEIGFFRSAWNDPRALWLGFKGGDAASDHGHLDRGSFVLEAVGQRWAIDLGPDDYNLPGYFGPKRWTYYRLGTASHNTLLIDGLNQPPEARAPVVAFQGLEDDGRAVIDLSACYPMARTAHRGLAMIGGKCILIQDEVQAEAPLEILWGMLTRAKVAAAGAEVTLEQGGERLRGRILWPQGATFDTVAADAPPPQGQQSDVRKLVVRLPQPAADVRLAVAFWPEQGGTPPPAGAVRPLAEWPGWSLGVPSGLMGA
jgi:hypothetical protein